MVRLETGYTLTSVLASAGTGICAGSVCGSSVPAWAYYLIQAGTGTFGAALGLAADPVLKGWGSGMYNGSMSMIGYSLSEQCIP